MAESSLRDLCFVISPAWLKRINGGTLMQAFSAPLDALVARTNEGVKARFPGYGANDALGYIGNDRQIERGPSQSNSGYAGQLSAAFDTWRNAGGARTILSQLRYYFAPDVGPVMRTVSDRATWHDWDPNTGITTKTTTAGNWNWDGTTKKWRAWVIVEGSTYIGPRLIGEPPPIGEGTIGTDLSVEAALTVKRIVKKWMRASCLTMIIVTFDTDTFESTDSSPPNPDGSGDDPDWRLSKNAAFSEQFHW